MIKYFLDASYIIALESADDQNHIPALEHWQRLRNEAPLLVTSSYVFDEVVTFFNSRNRHDKAVEVGTRLIGSPSVDLIHVDSILFFQGWEFFQRHSDKSYSLTDSISFLIMEKHKITKTLTFDRHFVQAGYEKLPL